MDEAGNKVALNFIRDPTILIPGSNLVKGLYVGYRVIKDVVVPVADKYIFYFKDAINKAKLTGRLLAISLALGFPFST